MCKKMPDDFDDLELEESEEKVEQPKQIKSKTPASAKAAPPVTKSKTPASKSAGSESGPRKNVFFKSTVGPERTEKLSVGTNAPVREIKDTLANIFGLSPDDFHLSHAGRTMDENSPLGEYGVDNGDEILLIPQSTAG